MNGSFGRSTRAAMSDFCGLPTAGIDGGGHGRLPPVPHKYGLVEKELRLAVEGRGSDGGRSRVAINAHGTVDKSRESWRIEREREKPMTRTRIFT